MLAARVAAEILRERGLSLDDLASATSRPGAQARPEARRLRALGSENHRLKRVVERQARIIEMLRAALARES